MERLHIVLLCDPRLQLRFKPSFSGFNLFRTDRHNQNSNNMAGGTAILAFHKLPTTQILPAVHSFMSLEATLVPTKTHSSIIYLASVYCPNQSLDTGDFSNLFNFCTSYLRPSNKSWQIIIGDDLNAKDRSWLDTAHNPNGFRLYDWLTTAPPALKFRNFSPGQPSYIGCYTQSHLNHFLITNELHPPSNPTP